MPDDLSARVGYDECKENDPMKLMRVPVRTDIAVPQYTYQTYESGRPATGPSVSHLEFTIETGLHTSISVQAVVNEDDPLAALRSVRDEIDAFVREALAEQEQR